MEKMKISERIFENIIWIIEKKYLAGVGFKKCEKKCEIKRAREQGFKK